MSIPRTTKKQLRQDPIVERLESIHDDVRLILADVYRSYNHPAFSPDRTRELESAIHGMDTVIRDLSELSTSTKACVKAIKKYVR